MARLLKKGIMLKLRKTLGIILKSAINVIPEESFLKTAPYGRQKGFFQNDKRSVFWIKSNALTFFNSLGQRGTGGFDLLPQFIDFHVRLIN